MPIMSLLHLSHRRFSWWLLGLACVLGCSSSDSPDQSPWEIDASTLVPVNGVVTLNGKPLAGAVLGFMSSTGIPAIAETGKDGKYTLTTTELPGAIPGDYKVTISHLVSPEGESQSLKARSALIQSPAMSAAVEQLPPEYSDLKLTKLSVQIGSEGGTFPFDLVAPVEAAEDETAKTEPVKDEATKSEAAEDKATDKDR